MGKEEIKNKIHQLIDEIEDESALNMLYEDAVEYKTSSSEVMEEDLTAEQWALIKKSKEEIKNGQFHTYGEVKQHFKKWLTK